MYHSIDFFYIDPMTDSSGSKKNTWDDWRLVASERPSIAPPEAKLSTVMPLGASRFYNLSEILTGYPTYGTRTGSIEFIVLNDYNDPEAKRWVDVYNEVKYYLHGQELYCVLEDEPDYMYSGLFKVNEFKSGEYNSTITIEYELQPYKLERQLSNADWLWDPFNFETGIIPTNKFRNITVTNSTPYQEDLTAEVGCMPVSPTIIINSWTATNLDADNCYLEFTADITDKRGKHQPQRSYKLLRRDMKTSPDDSQTVTYNNTITLPLFVIFDDVTSLAISTPDTSAEVNFDISFRKGRL